MSKNNLFTLLVAAFVLAACNQNPQTSNKLAILCSNDSHSQIEPAKDGCGGYAARKHAIDSIRQMYNGNVLLLDAGDIFQGTPFFNNFNGRLEIEGYNLMGYDATTFGNHEFDKGIDTLAARMSEAKFAYVCCNYDVTGTKIEQLTKPYAIFDKNGLRVGVLGLGVDPTGLILSDYFGGIRYLDPVESANSTAEILKNDEKCDFVIALSHLGYSTNPDEMSDSIVAIKSRNIDLILGGHTHDIRGAFDLQNTDNQPIKVMQCGKSAKELDLVVVEY